jgi:hypothetical protein
LTTFLFEFVYDLKQAIYTHLVVICGQQNYKLDTKYVIGGVVEEGTREGEKCCDLRLRRRQAWDGWAETSPNKNNFLLFLKSISCFLEMIFTSGFITPTASEIDFHWRFYYTDRKWKSIFTNGPQLSACKNDDFYWPLALAVTKNATVNRFTTATIELLCTSDCIQHINHSISHPNLITNLRTTYIYVKIKFHMYNDSVYKKNIKIFIT